MHPVSASEYSKRTLKQYNNDAELAYEKTGLRLPLTYENVKGRVGRIIKGCATIMDKKPKLIFRKEQHEERKQRKRR
jgi:hypothetical protein